jgi:tryptophan 2,3-dioxygenase
MPDIDYSTYLRLHEVLGAQHPVSPLHGVEAHDEMLFIVTHQVYELWFKQIIYELDSVLEVLQRDSIDDNTGDMGIIVQRVNRMAAIWRLLGRQIDILETMSPLDFLEFRNFLMPASGFQSVQFKLIEAKAGLRVASRYGGEYYKHMGHGGVSETDHAHITAAETRPTIKTLLRAWLERMPYLMKKLWTSDLTPRRFLTAYRRAYLASLNNLEDRETRRDEFSRIFVRDGHGDFTPAAMRSALFIMLYRDYPVFQLPYQFLVALLEFDEQLSIWRYRHLMMLSRMIGLRVGTGGVNREGKNKDSYLEGALKSNRLFAELADLSTYLIERRMLPQIPVGVLRELGFAHS